MPESGLTPEAIATAECGKFTTKMAATGRFLGMAGVLLSRIPWVQGQEACGDERYVCKQGHCCGQGRCCTNYYELWGFWVLWVTVALLVGCCYYQQKRLRRQALPFIQRSRRGRRSRSGRRARSRSRSRNHATPSNQVGSTSSQQTLTPVFHPDKVLRLPTYDEIKDLPKDPPAYSILFSETRLPETVLSALSPAGATGPVRPMGRSSVESSEICDSQRACLLANEAGTSEDHVGQAPPTDAPPTDAPPPYSSGPPPCSGRELSDRQTPPTENESTSRLAVLFIR